MLFQYWSLRATSPCLWIQVFITMVLVTSDSLLNRSHSLGDLLQKDGTIKWRETTWVTFKPSICQLFKWSKALGDPGLPGRSHSGTLQEVQKILENQVWASARYLSRKSRQTESLQIFRWFLVAAKSFLGSNNFF